jgi:pentatricopeptide repeat protein
MKNYLYLTWLEIWAFTFWYNEIGEKHYRFDQMLDVLDKVIHHEMNIFNLMFDVLNKHGEPQMMLKLYQKLLQKKINPSFYIYDIMSKVLDKKQIKNLLEELKKNYSKELKFNDYNRKNNRERTFLSITDDLPLETKPRFYYDYYCISCGEKINIFSISKKFEDIRNDILWVKCKKCGEYNLPKIIVKFGLDFINTQSKATPTEDFVLHSPYNLKINIRNAVVTHYGMDINIPNFKSQFQPLFWNFIWYCVIHGLDYNILLPYSKNLEQLKETLFYNPNREIFEVSYDDSAFKENQNKIERISTRIKQQNNEIDKKHTFEILKICSEVIKLELGGEGEEEYNEGNSFEIKEDTGNEKEDLENFMKIRPKIKMFAELEGLDDQKEDEKKKEDEKDEEQLIKEAEEHNEALFPTSW